MAESIIKKERSRAYPVMPLSEALVRIKSINENLGSRGQCNRETIATGMGYTGLNGASARSVAALTHYGFLDRNKDQYSLSGIAKKYLMPLEDSDQAIAMSTAALSPVLFSEIYESFKGQVIPKQFVNRLIQEFGIQQKVAPEVERIFKETMVTAGILQSNNILNSTTTSDTKHIVPSLLDNEKDEYANDEVKASKIQPAAEPNNYLNVKLPSGILVSYEQNLASAFAFGLFGAKLKELDDAVTEYKKANIKEVENDKNE
jgi:hypothetical protein